MAPQASSQNTRQKLLDTAERIMAHKGFRSVGLNEILSQAGVPKGSFYHFFGSKEAFGQAIVHDYFIKYMHNMNRLLDNTVQNASERLMAYFTDFRERQSGDDFQGGCLVVKLGPEVSDFSESMRSEMKRGVEQILDRLERTIVEGIADKSMVSSDPTASAALLYDIWLGASIIAKINRDPTPFDAATVATRDHLRPGTATLSR